MITLPWMDLIRKRKEFVKTVFTEDEMRPINTFLAPILLDGEEQEIKINAIIEGKKQNE